MKNAGNRKGGTYMANKKSIGLGVAAVAAAGAGAALAAKNLQKKAHVGLESGDLADGGCDEE